MGRAFAILTALIASLSACGENPTFTGTEFDFVIGAEKEVVTIDEPARPCDFAASYEGWGVDTDDFGFYVADLQPGTSPTDTARIASHLLASDI